MTIQQDLRKSAVGTVIELYILDLSPLGGEVMYLSPHANANTAIVFDGHEYIPMPIKGVNYEKSIAGAPPQPKLTVSNVTRLIQPYINAYQGLVGAKVTRFRTLDKYLDGGSSPDPSQVFDSDTFLIQQKTKHNKLEVEFKLSSVIDADNEKLPRMVVLRSRFPGVGLFRK